MSALDTFISRVAWAPLDVLVLDMPPGTGDAQISISQRLRLAGAVIISTPQVPDSGGARAWGGQAVVWAQGFGRRAVMLPEPGSATVLVGGGHPPARGMGFAEGSPVVLLG